MKPVYDMSRDELEAEVYTWRGQFGMESFEQLTLALRERLGLVRGEAGVLAALYQAKGRCLSLEFLAGMIDASSDEVVRLRACRLRKALGPAIVETLYLAGYRLTTIGVSMVDRALGRLAA